MSRLSRLTLVCLVFLVFPVCLACLSNQPVAWGQEPPNIVIILADDLGYGDVSPLNPASKIPTPSFERLAEQGMSFTDAHSPSAVCTPTRYGLLCGRYPWRSPMKRGVLGGYSRPLLNEDQQTIASLLKRAGYTTGCVGKWHLGLGWQWKNNSPKDINNMGIAGGEPGQVDYSQPLTFSPQTVGFDYSLIIPASLDMSPYLFVENGKVTAPVSSVQPGSRFPAFYRRGEWAEDFEMDAVLDRLTEAACSFIRRQAGDQSPFFLYFPLSAPHKPVWPHPRFEGKTELGPYGDFVAQVDWTVGEVIRSLDDAGATENTLLIVTSDNGSFMYRLPDRDPDHSADATVHGYNPRNHTANGPWRGTKADIYEAGHRIPFFIRWPGQVANGSINDQLLCQTDLLATCCEAAGVEFDPNQSEDSFSLMPLLRGESRQRPPVIHQSGNGHLAIRSATWKLIMSSGSGGREKPVGKAFEKPYQLYHLANDPGETTNLIGQHPQQAWDLNNQFQTLSQGNHRD